MLQTIRDRTQGLVVAVIVGLICLTFALWGVESYINSERRVVVAEVNGDEIGLDEFQQALQRVRRQAESVLGEQYNAEDWNKPDIKMRGLDGLINERIVAGLMDEARIRVSDAQLASEVQKIPAFQQDGAFSRTLFDQRVSLLGFSPVGFELQMRADMAQAQLRSGIAASEFTLRAESERLQRLREQKRDIGYAIIPNTEFADKVSVSDADIEKHYADHQEDYRVPEKAALEYLELSAATLANEVVVTDEALQQFYDANHALYTTVEERNVNHILIQAAKSASDTDISAARNKAEELLKRARAGDDFEKLAQEFSDDTGSKTDGGETGLFPRGVMAPEFEEVAFELAVGEISEPVKTDFGFHLIKLKETKAGGLKSFADAKSDVQTAYRSAEAQKMFIDQAEQFSNLVYEHPDSLDVAADALNLKAQKAESLTQVELATRFSEKLGAVVFEADVLIDGLNSEPIELPDGRIVAVRVTEHRASAIAPLAEVKAQIKAELEEQQIRQLTENAGKELIEKLRGGATITDLVKNAGFDWQKVENANRDSTDVNRAVLREAFRVEATESDPVYAGIAIGKADYAVIRVANVEVPSSADIDKTAIKTLGNDLTNNRAGDAWRDFVAALRASSEVKIYNNNL